MRYAVLSTVSFLFVLIACGCRAVENYTDAEKAALRNQGRPGRASIAVRDAVTGQPVAECNYYAFKFSTDETGVDRRLPIMVSRRRQPESPGGNHEFDLVPGWYRLRLCSRTYRPAWTPRFEILEGRTTFLATEVKKANRIRVTVLEGDGSACATGTLLLRGQTDGRKCTDHRKGRRVDPGCSRQGPRALRLEGVAGGARGCRRPCSARGGCPARGAN